MKNWAEIYDKELIYAPNCWMECDGYCCQNFFGKHFKFLDKESVILPLIEEEYAEYKKRGGIENLKETKKTIPIKDKSITLYLLKCQEKGLCNPHQNRPFICRVYPYFPVVSQTGEIIDFTYAALMDNLVSKEYHKCPLTKEERTKKEIVKNLGTIEDPKIIFIFMLTNLLIEHLKKYIPDRIDSPRSERKLVAKFEKLILGNKIFKDKSFKDEAAAIYDALVKQYGEFL